jgi:hypothetical protein
MDFNNLPAHLSTKETSQYLRDKHGVTRTGKTLDKLASIGGGPPYRKDGRLRKYEPSILDEWVEEKLTSQVTSTAEYAEGLARGKISSIEFIRTDKAAPSRETDAPAQAQLENRDQNL